MRAALAIVCTFASQAQAQMACGPAEEVIARHAEINETPDSIGLGADGSQYIVLVNPQTGGWSIVKFNPSGLACLMIVGTDWTTDKTPPGEKM